uniref:Uncharacterized protein n=1 Tax=Meloidogyne incognita TaxID=6306 RepID=A0A914LZV1_MELIC
MNWTFTNCSCTSGQHCIRPEAYSKPRLCIPTTVPPTEFANFLARPENYINSGFGGYEKFVLNTILLLIILSLGLKLFSLCYRRNKMSRQQHHKRQKQQQQILQNIPLTELTHAREAGLPGPLVIDVRENRPTPKFEDPRAAQTLKKMETLVAMESTRASF